MAQCLHLEESGRRCRQEAVPGLWFCGGHDPEMRLEASPLGPLQRKFVVRVAALALLAAVLGPLLLGGLQWLLDWLN